MQDQPTRACPVPLSSSIAALHAEVAALDAVMSDLGAADLARATRCTEWPLELLLAHLVRGVDRLRAYLAESLADEPPSIGWLSYWTTVAVVADSASITERARAFASQLNDRPVAKVWEEASTRALEVLAAAPADRGVPTPFGTLRIDHYATTRVVELVVHGLDVRHSLGLEEVATPQGLALTTQVADALLPGDRAPDLRDDMAFVLAATGRRPSDDSRLPLLG